MNVNICLVVHFEISMTHVFKKKLNQLLIELTVISSADSDETPVYKKDPAVPVAERLRALFINHSIISHLCLVWV